MTARYLIVTGPLDAFYIDSPYGFQMLVEWAMDKSLAGFATKHSVRKWDASSTEMVLEVEVFPDDDPDWFVKRFARLLRAVAAYRLDEEWKETGRLSDERERE